MGQKLPVVAASNSPVPAPPQTGGSSMEGSQHRGPCRCLPLTPGGPALCIKPSRKLAGFLAPSPFKGKSLHSGVSNASRHSHIPSLWVYTGLG